jgi:hypothetical protein
MSRPITSTAGAFVDPLDIYITLGTMLDQIETARRTLRKSGLLHP